MIAPALSGDAFLDNVAAARSRKRGFRLWWLGQSGFLIQSHGRHLLLDPYLSNSLAAQSENFATPRVRVTRRPIEPERLNFIDVVATSNLDGDHFDPETLLPLLKVNREMPLVIPEANRAVALERLETKDMLCVTGTDNPPLFSRLKTLTQRDSIELSGFKIHAVAAAQNSIEKDELGRCTSLGYVVEMGSWTLYYSGDTARYPDMAAILRKWQIDVALLPINGQSNADPARNASRNLSGPEAAELARDVGVGIAIPCHYDMFESDSPSPAAFAAKSRELNQPFHVLQCGERWSSDDLARAR